MPMRIAFISDIHANLEALEAVFEDIDTQAIDEIICLGDIVGYGANPNECVELVRKRCSTILLGNHDAAAVDLLATHHFNSHAKIAIEWTAGYAQKRCAHLSAFSAAPPDTRYDDA
jgi:predicted phosphodiesterase